MNVQGFMRENGITEFTLMIGSVEFDASKSKMEINTEPISEEKAPGVSRSVFNAIGECGERFSIDVIDNEFKGVRAFIYLPSSVTR